MPKGIIHETYSKNNMYEWKQMRYEIWRSLFVILIIDGNE